MADSKRGGNLDFNLDFGRVDPNATPLPDRPFRILLLGDFSGRAGRDVREPVVGRRAHKVDCDEVDALIARLAVNIRLGSGENTVDVPISELEDFHPDALYNKLPEFAELRALRRRLRDPATFRDAAAEVRAWAAPEAADVPPPPAEPEAETDTQETQDPGDLLENLLGKKPAAPGSPTQIPTEVSGRVTAMIRDIVAPHIVDAPDPQQAELVAAVDAATSSHMRAVLHHPAFRAVEGAWRGLDLIVRSVETDEEMEIRVLDVSKAELWAELNAAGDVRETGIFQTLVGNIQGIPDAAPWSMVAALYTFSQDQEADGVLLQVLGTLSALAKAPLFTHAMLGAPGADGEPTIAPTWQALAKNPAAAYIVLALPRLLLRLPYGSTTESAERFDFEEMPSPPNHDQYLWGNPAIACTCMIGQAFAQAGWDFSVRSIAELADLPLHYYKVDGESEMTPCAEFWITEHDAEALARRGLMPLLSVKGRAAVQAHAFQTLARREIPFDRPTV